MVAGACSKLWRIIVIYYNNLEQAPVIILVATRIVFGHLVQNNN